nr:hypothetical protein SHINE37_120170 [Rhizobiaceae bacterium]
MRPKNRRSSRPSQKVGIDSSTVAVPTKARSVRLFWRQAAMTPAGTATRLARRTATTTISALTRKRDTTSGSTASSLTIDRPKSPCSTLPAQIRNCCGMDLSRPSSVRISAICSGWAMSPSMRAAGSPGMKRMSAKTVTDTSAIVGRAITRRLRMNLSIVSPRLGADFPLGRHRFRWIDYDGMNKTTQYYAILSYCYADLRALPIAAIDGSQKLSI